MIPVTYIKRNAKTLTTRFNRSHKPLMTFLYAKLVIIEVGGWIEISMDDLVERAGKKLKVNKNIAMLGDNIIGKNYGFDYERNFRQMLMKVIGIVMLEKLESKLDVAKQTKMKASLELLKRARNSVAHTYVKNPAIGATITAPSVAMAYFFDIYNGLKDIETQMKKLKLI